MASHLAPTAKISGMKERVRLSLYDNVVIALLKFSAAVTLLMPRALSLGSKKLDAIMSDLL